MAKAPQDLSPKERIFCGTYISNGCNATRAYMEAYEAENYGTAGTEGNKLLKKPAIKAEIARLTKASFTRLEISTDYILGTIQETIERCRQAVPVLDKRGNPVEIEDADGSMSAAYVFDSKGVLKGCELLGRYKKLFTDRVEHSGGIVLKHSVSRPER